MTMNENKQLRDNLRQVLAYCDELGYELGFAGVEAKQALEHRDKQAEPVAWVPENWTVFNSGAEVKRDLSFQEAWDYMTPERLARGWCAVCVVDGGNMPTQAQPVQPAGAQQPVAFCVEFDQAQLGRPTMNRQEAEEVAALVPRKRRVVNLFREAPAAAINEQLLEALRPFANLAEYGPLREGMAKVLRPHEREGFIEAMLAALDIVKKNDAAIAIAEAQIKEHGL